MYILSFDIGGANTKFCVLKEGVVLEYSSFYFPMWRKKNRFENFIRSITKKIRPDAVAVTTTAELSDAFRDKKEGVTFVLETLKGIFCTPIHVLSFDGILRIDEALERPYSVASANFLAVPTVLARKIKNAIVADCGSTTTDITPVIGGAVASLGRNDTERLQNCELVYTGALRTNVSSIVKYLHVGGKKTGISSEFFAQSADTNIILGDISGCEYVCDAPDGRRTCTEDAMARLARVVCADTNMLSTEDIRSMAAQVQEMQVKDIAENLKYVSKRYRVKPDIFITGSGGFLAEKAASMLGLKSRYTKLTACCALGLMVKTLSDEKRRPLRAQ